MIKHLTSIFWATKAKLLVVVIVFWGLTTVGMKLLLSKVGSLSFGRR